MPCLEHDNNPYQVHSNCKNHAGTSRKNKAKTEVYTYYTLSGNRDPYLFYRAEQRLSGCNLEQNNLSFPDLDETICNHQLSYKQPYSETGRLESSSYCLTKNTAVDQQSPV